MEPSCGKERLYLKSSHHTKKDIGKGSISDHLQYGDYFANKSIRERN
jgi:hypothetical protein